MPGGTVAIIIVPMILPRPTSLHLLQVKVIKSKKQKPYSGEIIMTEASQQDIPFPPGPIKEKCAQMLS